MGNQCLTSELTDICGATHANVYKRNTTPHLRNRYNRDLAVTYQFDIVPEDDEYDERSLGTFSLLPILSELDDRAAVNLLLEDLTGKTQEDVRPPWADAIPMPGDKELNGQIKALGAEIKTLEENLQSVLDRKAAKEEFKKLLYASDAELEQIFAKALQVCGGAISPAKYSQEEFLLGHGGQDALVECKGVGKSVALTHLRQLLDYMLRSEEEEGKPLKGILLGNAWRNLPPDQRGGSERPIFPTNVIARAKQVGVALVDSVEFFDVMGKVLHGEISGTAVLALIMNSAGPVDFSKLS